MHGLFQDIRTAARALRRQPVLTLAAAICLALGIGANTTVFSALRAYVLYPIPAADAEGLVMVAEQSEGTDRWFDRMSPATFDDLRRASTTIRDLAAYHWWDVNITGGDQPEQVVAFAAEPRLFALLGARPLLGRVIGDDRSATPEALLSEPLWRRRFGGAPAVVGRKVEINGDPYVVSGVMDARFVFPAGAELWVPMRLSPAEAVEREGR